MTIRSTKVFRVPAPIFNTTLFFILNYFPWMSTVYALVSVNPIAKPGTKLQPRVLQDPVFDARSNRVWVPPAQNVEQRRGNIFTIRQPKDLLDFIIEDERLCIVKVYANWCRTCKVIDTRYRKLASQYGDKYDDTKTGKGNHIIRKGRAKFAEMEYNGSNAKVLAALLGSETIPLPHFLVYRGSTGMVKNFHCTPNNLQMLVDAVNELADPALDESDGGNPKGNEFSEKGLNILRTLNGDDGLDEGDFQFCLDKSTSSEKGLGATNFYLSNLNMAR